MELPIFLSVDDVLELHAGQLAQYGGGEGLRERGLLESAVAQASMTFGGELLHKDMFMMAACYLFHLVCNHPFLDGNKRVGLEAAFVFLEINGYSVETTDEALVDLVLRTATNNSSKEEIAEIFRAHAIAHGS